MNLICILQYQPSETDYDHNHDENPFDGVSVLYVGEAVEGDDYMDVIGPVEAEFPGAKFLIITHQGIERAHEI